MADIESSVPLDVVSPEYFTLKGFDDKICRGDIIHVEFTNTIIRHDSKTDILVEFFDPVTEPEHHDGIVMYYTIHREPEPRIVHYLGMDSTMISGHIYMNRIGNILNPEEMSFVTRMKYAGFKLFYNDDRLTIMKEYSKTTQ